MHVPLPKRSKFPFESSMILVMSALIHRSGSCDIPGKMLIWRSSDSESRKIAGTRAKPYWCWVSFTALIWDRIWVLRVLFLTLILLERWTIQIETITYRKIKKNQLIYSLFLYCRMTSTSQIEAPLLCNHSNRHHQYSIQLLGHRNLPFWCIGRSICQQARADKFHPNHKLAETKWDLTFALRP